jgi:hypothetical protein
MEGRDGRREKKGEMEEGRRRVRWKKGGRERWKKGEGRDGRREEGRDGRER